MPDQVEQALRSLERQLAGRVSRPGKDGYAAATAIWAKPVGRMPRAVVHCRTTEDVQLSIGIARDCGLPASVRGGGHDWAGRALCAGVVIDLSGMNGVSVDADHHIAIISGGDRPRCAFSEPDRMVCYRVKAGQLLFAFDDRAAVARSSCRSRPDRDSAGVAP